MKKLTGVVAVVACLGLAACSQVEDMVDKNKGGKTTCGDYMKLDQPQRTDVVLKFLEEKGVSQANDIAVTANKTAILTFCSTVASSTDPISNTPIIGTPPR
ncbi:hypothetical protein [Gordonia sp. (in: high G+C Gram-positive bacteria)]|uniref:hypothetical protein n=1 Tax=Gordonia sp. (in: high G+C Gram-positive bacteria) TaxID=84139 RepID=UPI0039E23701